MPIYPWQCDVCGDQGEITCSVEEQRELLAEMKCPCCGESVRRLYTSFGIEYKGTGFHHTDYTMVERVKKAKVGKN